MTDDEVVRPAGDSPLDGRCEYVGGAGRVSQELGDYPALDRLLGRAMGQVLRARRWSASRDVPVPARGRPVLPERPDHVVHKECFGEGMDVAVVVSDGDSRRGVPCRTLLPTRVLGRIEVLRDK
jgi:hypothetical protein